MSFVASFFKICPVLPKNVDPVGESLSVWLGVESSSVAWLGRGRTEFTNKYTFWF